MTFFASSREPDCCSTSCMARRKSVSWGCPGGPFSPAMITSRASSVLLRAAGAMLAAAPLKNGVVLSASVRFLYAAGGKGASRAFVFGQKRESFLGAVSRCQYHQPWCSLLQSCTAAILCWLPGMEATFGWVLLRVPLLSCSRLMRLNWSKTYKAQHDRKWSTIACVCHAPVL